MKVPDEALKQAARNYLAAIEDDGPLEDVTKAKDNLAEIAVLWAQAEIIEQVEKKHNA